MDIQIDDNVGMRALLIGSRAGLLVAMMAGCTDYVLVTLVLPDVKYDKIALDKKVDGLVVASFQRPADGGTIHSLDLSMPDHGKVSLLARAYWTTALVAEGELEVIRGANEQRLKLEPCERPLDAASAGPCRPASTGEPAPDAGADGGSDLRPDGNSTEGAGPVCYPQALPDDRPIGGLPPPVSSSEGCRTYCEAVHANCISAAFYNNSIDECLYACSLLNWNATSSTGDTLKCRLNFAQAAATATTDFDHLRFCRFAMPNGSPGCGTQCDVYCRMGSVVCQPYFPKEADCLNACNSLVASGMAANPDIPAPALACRLFYLEKAIFNQQLCGWAAPNMTCPGPDPGCNAVVF
ncbi:MAG: hypothetical protein ABIS92_07645 [Polyangia bacterium]